MNQTEKILEIARNSGIIRAIDLKKAGVSRNYLYKLHESGLLFKISRGLYKLPKTPVTEHSIFSEIAKRIPKAVICLLSALTFHGATTQLPHEIWIALPKGAWRPHLDYPSRNVTYVSGEAYFFGVKEHKIDGVIVKIYSPAKTVADCFKFRNKVGLDVAIEALREVWRSRKATMDELFEAAKTNRMLRIMRPYLEAMA
ncbi:MAG: AbiEi antitoxin N-terminal domain-containing protein [Candidatus Riflebacteria bacterium]|nr:AbiEi antitoxin N-terminal domain-containing protein [Candidatus Riflebacteria bacterium]